jgi:hypothetical protein
MCPELAVRLERRVALAHPVAALVQLELDLELVVVTDEIRILGGVPGAAHDRRRAEEDSVAVAGDERVVAHAGV